MRPSPISGGSSGLPDLPLSGGTAVALNELVAKSGMLPAAGDASPHDIDDEDAPVEIPQKDVLKLLDERSAVYAECFALRQELDALDPQFFEQLEELNTRTLSQRE